MIRQLLMTIILAALATTSVHAADAADEDSVAVQAAREKWVKNKGYKVYYGVKSGSYGAVVDIPNPSLTTYVVQDLSAGTYYFALAAYNTQGVESGLTPELSVAVD